MEIREPVPVSPVPAGSATRFWVRAGALPPPSPHLGAFLRVPLPYVPFTHAVLFCALSGFLLGPEGASPTRDLHWSWVWRGSPCSPPGEAPPTCSSLPSATCWASWSPPHWWVALPGVPDPHEGLRVAMAGVLGVYALGVPWLWGVFNLHLGDPGRCAGRSPTAFWLHWGETWCSAASIALGAVRPAAAGGHSDEPRGGSLPGGSGVSRRGGVCREEALALRDAPLRICWRGLPGSGRPSRGGLSQLCAIVPFASGACGGTAPSAPSPPLENPVRPPTDGGRGGVAAAGGPGYGGARFLPGGLRPGHGGGTVSVGWWP
jgi:hypothetical protein